MKKATLALLLFLASSAPAQEEDGSRAPPERWSHPRGPASGSGRSHARVPWSYKGILWTVKAKASFLAPPVTWDGVGFVLDGTRKKVTLIAFDREGTVLARTELRVPVLPRPAAWNRSVFLVEEETRLTQLRLKGRSFTRPWTYEAGKGCYPPRILGGEVYLATPRGLERLRPGSGTPVWTAKGMYRGEPAILRDHVYALRRSAEGKRELVVLNRSDGEIVLSAPISGAPTSQRGVRVAVSEAMVAVGLPAEEENWILFRREVKEGKLSVTGARAESLVTDPIVGGMALALTPDETWSVLTFGKRPLFHFVSKKDRPELFEGATSPIVLNGMICFGTWAADVNTNRIFWHLTEHRKIKEFNRGLRFNAVPMDHELLLMVPKDGKRIHAIGPEIIGE
ncbi:MAG: PQQ-binding-like beta-propeller repeat protein [Planctomycetota bacterium]